jgi:hypothetical protein
MTDTVQQTYSEAIAASHERHEVQMWQAAQTVRSHVSPEQGQDDMLECLGLQDVVRPAGL